MAKKQNTKSVMRGVSAKEAVKGLKRAAKLGGGKLKGVKQKRNGLYYFYNGKGKKCNPGFNYKYNEDGTVDITHNKREDVEGQIKGDRFNVQFNTKIKVNDYRILRVNDTYYIQEYRRRWFGIFGKYEWGDVIERSWRGAWEEVCYSSLEDAKKWIEEKRREKDPETEIIEV